MRLISHRGNINGKFESYENEPNYIDLAIKKGYDVEVDIWYIGNILYLGHDKPQYEIDFRWIRDRVTDYGFTVKMLKLCFILKNADIVLIIFGIKRIQ